MNSLSFLSVVCAFLQLEFGHSASSTGPQGTENQTANAARRQGTFVVPLENYHNVQYYTHLRIGTPWQTFKVVFDTAGVSWVPSIKCRTSELCRNRTKFDRSQSSSYDGPLFSILANFRESHVLGYMGKDNLQLDGGPTAKNTYIMEVTKWIPREGKRSRGWQKVRWADEIKNFAGIGWAQVLKDRVNWRGMGMAFALQWV
ncbi:cathepsin D-like [Amblyomma americanum]